MELEFDFLMSDDKYMSLNELETLAKQNFDSSYWPLFGEDHDANDRAPTPKETNSNNVSQDHIKSTGLTLNEVSSQKNDMKLAGISPLTLTKGTEISEVLHHLSTYSAPKATHARDSLRFGRRLSKLVIEQLCSTRSDGFVDVFLRVSSNVISSILSANYGFETANVIKIEDLVKLQAVVLHKVWEEFKTCLSYHTNKKICLMKSEYWDIVFSQKTFRAHAKLHLAEVAISLDPNLSLIANNEVMSTSFCDVMYSMNKLMTLAYVLKDETLEGGYFFKELAIMESLIVLMVEPALFDYYNQSSGRFANECCGKCKVCCSKNVPESLHEQLETARKKANALVDVVVEFCPRSLKGIKEEDLMYVFCLAIQ